MIKVKRESNIAPPVAVYTVTVSGLTEEDLRVLNILTGRNRTTAEFIYGKSSVDADRLAFVLGEIYGVLK